MLPPAGHIQLTCLIEFQLPTFRLRAQDPSNHRTHGRSRNRHTHTAPGGGGGKVHGTRSSEHFIPEPASEIDLAYVLHEHLAYDLAPSIET